MPGSKPSSSGKPVKMHKQPARSVSVPSNITKRGTQDKQPMRSATVDIKEEVSKQSNILNPSIDTSAEKNEAPVSVSNKESGSTSSIDKETLKSPDVAKENLKSPTSAKKPLKSPVPEKKPLLKSPSAAKETPKLTSNKTSTAVKPAKSGKTPLKSPSQPKQPLKSPLSPTKKQSPPTSPTNKTSPKGTAHDTANKKETQSQEKVNEIEIKSVTTDDISNHKNSGSSEMDPDHRRELRHSIMIGNLALFPEIQPGSFYLKLTNAINKKIIVQFEKQLKKIAHADRNLLKKWQILFAELPSTDDDANKVWNLIMHAKETEELAKQLRHEFKTKQDQPFQKVIKNSKNNEEYSGKTSTSELIHSKIDTVMETIDSNDLQGEDKGHISNLLQEIGGLVDSIKLVQQKGNNAEEERSKDKLMVEKQAQMYKEEKAKYAAEKVVLKQEIVDEKAKYVNEKKRLEKEVCDLEDKLSVLGKEKVVMEEKVMHMEQQFDEHIGKINKIEQMDEKINQLIRTCQALVDNGHQYGNRGINEGENHADIEHVEGGGQEIEH